jgi:hypothetical protein
MVDAPPETGLDGAGNLTRLDRLSLETLDGLDLQIHRLERGPREKVDNCLRASEINKKSMSEHEVKY